MTLALVVQYVGADQQGGHGYAPLSTGPAQIGHGRRQDSGRARKRAATGHRGKGVACGKFTNVECLQMADVVAHQTCI